MFISGLFNYCLIKLLLLSIFTSLITIINTQKVDILMPNVTTTIEDAYMCVSYKIGDDQKYITSFEPLTNMNIAHHMFAFGCERPSVTNKAWNCGNDVCIGEKSILFAWGRNAPSLDLPKDVAFKVGTQTKFRYIVINMHYLKKVNNDASGLRVAFSNKPPLYYAGIFLLLTGRINIPPMTKYYHTEMSCKYERQTKLNVFAFRVHAHVHGDVNTAYRIRNHEWKQLARGDPQWPQSFYPISDGTIEINNGDILVGRCVYHNDENRNVYAGATHNDEMCNIYLMYYTDSDEDIDENENLCASNSYPQLESIIPEEANKKPAPPPTDASKNGGDNDQSKNLHHHDMEGGALSKSFVNRQQQKQSPLISLLNNYEQFKQQQQQQSLNDDYYTDIERSRSKLRNNNNNDYGDQGGNFLYDNSDFVDNIDDFDYQRDNSLFDQSPLSLFNKNYNRQNNNKNTKSPVAAQYLKPLKPFKSVYTLINNWYDPNTIKLGHIGGLAYDSSHSYLYVFHRGSQTWQDDSFSNDFRFNIRKYPLIKEDAIVALNSNTGKLVKSFGANMFLMPHGITIDSMGNVWVTDVGRHQVLKFDYNAVQPSLEIGERGVPGSDKKHLCQPSDVAVLRNGEFFVADGYCNKRIIHFDKNGNYLSEISSDESGKPANFFIPHSLALNELMNLLCVADRENYRVQCFDLNGNFLHQTLFTDYGPIYSVAFASNNASLLYALNGYAYAKETQYEKKIFTIESASGAMNGQISLDREQVTTPHDLVLTDDSTEIYIGNLNPPKIVKYALLNYNLNDKRKPGSTNNSTNKTVPLKDHVDPDKENFRTSMFIMAFLTIPLVIVVLIAIFVRLRNMGKLRQLMPQKQHDIGKWLKSKTSVKSSKNGFTRLTQESDVEEEAEPLDDNGSESDEITVPLSKA